MAAYAQSKLAITIWSAELAREMPDGPVFVAVNPGSLLATKMVKEGFGIDGKDLNIGADILVTASLSDAFATASGQYFDNDSGVFAAPHAAAADAGHMRSVMDALAVVVPALNYKTSRSTATAIIPVNMDRSRLRVFAATSRTITPAAHSTTLPLTIISVTRAMIRQPGRASIPRPAPLWQSSGQQKPAKTDDKAGKSQAKKGNPDVTHHGSSRR